MRRVQLLAVVQHINQTKAKYIHDVGGKRQQEEEEMAIIPPTNAVVHPRTVVVKVLREHKGQQCTNMTEGGMGVHKVHNEIFTCFLKLNDASQIHVLTTLKTTMGCKSITII